MCLLILSWQPQEKYALVLAANRDERYDRPTEPFAVLRARRPRTLGGLDLVGGGTWLGVNEHGVVAGLTNTPSPDGPDPSKRSRGEVPMFLTAHASAEQGVEAFIKAARPGTYNAARLLVGDRNHLYYLELDANESPSVHELAPGLYVLENAALGGSSSKARFVEELLVNSTGTADDLWRALPSVISSHRSLEPMPDEVAQAEGRSLWPMTRSPCVHANEYGTRSSTMLRVASDPDVPIQIVVSDGPPCSTPLRDVTATWTQPVAGTS